MAKIIRSRLSIIGLMATAGCVPFAAAQVYPEVAPQFTMFDSSGQPRCGRCQLRVLRKPEL